MLSTVQLSESGRGQVEVLKQYTFLATIYLSPVKLPEYRGYEVVKGIFDALSGDRGHLLMPEDAYAA
jgi:dGTPase